MHNPSIPFSVTEDADGFKQRTPEEARNSGYDEAWLSSLRNLLESEGVVVSFSRGPEDRANPACAVNLQRGEREADLVVWEAGDAELVSSTGGAVKQRHFDDVRDTSEPAALLTSILNIVQISEHPLRRNISPVN